METKKKISSLESELYLLIAKFLSTGPCKETAELLRIEIDKHELLPKRVDWLGNEHKRSFDEFNSTLSQIADDHLLKICARVGSILDKDIPPTVSGLTSLLGVGHQSLLRKKEDLQKPKCQSSNLMARKNGMPLFPSHAVQSTYPPNIAQVLISRETSGVLTTRHTFTPKVYARQQLYRRLLGHLSSVYCVLFDRTGKYIFTGADDTLVKVWSALDGRLLSALRGHSAEITDMAVNHENTLFAAGSCDKTIRVWCLRTTAPVAVLSGHTGMVTSLQFCPYPKNDDRLLISTGNDGCVCFWHWNPKNNAFNPKPLRFTERNKANAQMICSSFSSGGLFLATGSTDNNVRVYNIAGLNGPEKILEREAHTDRVDSLQFSNQDCRFVSGSKDGTALIWKYERQNWTNITLRMNTKLPGQSEEPEDTKTKFRVTMVGWTLDDDRVITAVSDHTIKVWNSYNGNLCNILKGHEDEVFVLESHPSDSRVFLSSGHDGRIIIWDLVTGTIIKNHFNLIEGQGHGAVFDCKFSPDGLSFASTDSHGHLSIFGFGAVERYKKVPEEQFFHTDYRPLIRDIHHHVLDEQTQTAPHLLPPPFLVDIDGNPYPPNFQRLVPGREHHNDSQLVPYVAVSAEGDAEVFEPVRPANDPDRPTIDDMIERLQQERNQNRENNLDSNDNSNQRGSTDSNQSPHSSRRSVSGNGERSVPEPPFSPRTPRAPAAHSRVGLRRTGDVEGVQSVGNWQSRGNDAPVLASTRRAVVRPMKPSLFKHDISRRMGIADYELSFFNREKKRRELPERCEVSRNPDIEKKRNGNRAGLRSTTAEDNSNPAFEEETEQLDTIHTSTSDSETEQENDNQTTDQSDSDYSDWVEDHPETKETRSSRVKAKPPKQRQPSTSGVTRRSASRRQIKAPRRLVSSGEDPGSADDDDDENREEEEDNDDDESPNSDTTPTRKPRRKQKSPKKKMKKKAVTGKKLPERFRPPEWLTDVMPHKAPYVPQIGDEVVYFRQGHELYVQAVKRNRVYDIYMRNQPWRTMNLRDQEVAKIDDITFENHPPRLCCLQLTLLNPATTRDETFTVKYHDMADVIDFIILKQNYDQAVYLDWKPGDRFRSAIDKAWWLGTVISQTPLNSDFPDSMFQSFVAEWDNGEEEQMSPWDFEPINEERLPNVEGGSVTISPEERLAMMYVPEPHEWSDYGCDHDCDRIARGLTRIMELEIAESFTAPVDLNLYPSYAIVVEYPMDLGTIKARVQNRFYRRVDAIKFDVRYIELNAQKFNEPASRIVKQAKCVVDLCIKFIDAEYCCDPMIFYNEMLEAKQSRSQDSQSELDVLCSEMDSDGEQSTSTRIKRKKQNSLQHPSKRVALENKKYTSNSWRLQASELLNTIFQCEDSTPFRQPVNLNLYPDYRDIIDNPMDLSTAREKLINNVYNDPTEFRRDMRFIFVNSRNYNTNKKSRIYSMTIRMSAMFEEHIRSIVGDWKSAIKYEEKIENNQYVSSRWKPSPSQESDVNMGASTSRGSFSSLPSSSRSESSRNAFNEGASHSHSKMTNGNGLKKKIKYGKSTSPFKKKILKTPTLDVLTNGDHRHARVSKRKLSDRSPRKHSERTRKAKSYTEEFSLSETNSNSEENASNSGDGEWNHAPKRRKKHSSSKKKRRSKKSSPEKRSTRPTRSSSNHQTSSYASLRSSSPEDDSLRKRSTRLRNSNRPMYSQDDSASASDRESHCDQTSNSSSKSSSDKNSPNSPVQRVTRRLLQSSNEESNSRGQMSSSNSPDNGDNCEEDSDYDASDNSEEDYSGEKPRKPKGNKRVRVLPARYKGENPKKKGRIQTRNRGQRTVQYQDPDSDEEDLENGASRSSNSRRHQAIEDDQKQWIPNGATENDEGPSASYSSGSSSRQSERNRNIRKSPKYSKKLSKYKPSFRSRSTLSSKMRKRATNRVFARVTSDSSIRNKANNISSSLRKCSELIKRSLKRPSYPEKVFSKSEAGKDSNKSVAAKESNKCVAAKDSSDIPKPTLKDSNPRVIQLKTTSIVHKRSGKEKTHTFKLPNTRYKVRPRRIIKKSSPISGNTRSHQGDVKQALIKDYSRVSPTKIGEKTGKPTIVFCKPSPTSSHTDLKSKVKADSDFKDKFSYTGNSHANPQLSKSLTETTSLACSSSKSGDNSSAILENNKSKWCLRKPNLTPRLSDRSSPHSDEAGSSTVQTRNNGQRTVVEYNEDTSNNYLTDILENEDPVKQRHSSEPAKEQQTTSSNSQDQLDYVESEPSDCASTSFLRPKKEALKMLSNGIETRNHGQRTTAYEEDLDDYLEEYLENYDL